MNATTHRFPLRPSLCYADDGTLDYSSAKSWNKDTLPPCTSRFKGVGVLSLKYPTKKCVPRNSLTEVHDTVATPSSNCDHVFEYDGTPSKDSPTTAKGDVKYLSDPLQVFPTPIAPLGMQIVEEIQLGTLWNHNDASTELVKSLLISRKGIQQEHTKKKPVISENTASVRKAAASHKVKTWGIRFEELVNYRKQFGNCLVPNGWKGNRSLAAWVKRQRYQKKLKEKGQSTTMTDQRFQALEDIGFVWSYQDSVWDEKFHALQAFTKKYGHCNVPSRFPEDHKLSVWVRCQRRTFKLKSLKQESNDQLKDELSLYRVSKLQSLGFDFNPRS